MPAINMVESSGYISSNHTTPEQAINEIV